MVRVAVESSQRYKPPNVELGADASSHTDPGFARDTAISMRPTESAGKADNAAHVAPRSCERQRPPGVVLPLTPRRAAYMMFGLVGCCTMSLNVSAGDTSVHACPEFTER